MLAQELEQRGEHARRAEAALQAVTIAKGFLEGMESSRRWGDAFNRGDVATVRLDCKKQAGARRAAVEEDGARAAHAVLAADVRAGELELMAQEIGEREPVLDAGLVRLAVDLDADGSHVPCPMIGAFR